MVKSIWNSINPKVENFLVLILCFISIIVSGISPKVSMIGVVVFPIPVALIYLKINKLKFIQIIGTITLVSFIVNGLWGTISAIACTIIVGAFLGEMLGTKKDGISIVKKMTVLIVGVILVAGMSYLISNKTTVNRIALQMESSYADRIDEIIKVYQDNGMSDTYTKPLSEYKSNFTSEKIIAVIPFIIAVVSLFSALIIYFLIRIVLSESIIPRHKKISFQYFYLSNLYGAALIGLFSIGIILTTQNVGVGVIISDGAMNILRYSLIINGFAMIVYLLKKKFNMSKFKIIIILLIANIIFTSGIIVMIGFIELLMDFRKLDPYSLRKIKKEQ